MNRLERESRSFFANAELEMRTAAELTDVFTPDELSRVKVASDAPRLKLKKAATHASAPAVADKPAKRKKR
jgi:hypothetical protein